MSKYPVKGAGDEDMRENPAVSSKGMRYHGKPHTPERVTHPGGTVPMTGTRVAGHTADGHRIPREVPHAQEPHVVTTVATDGNRVDASAKRSDSGALDRGKYSGQYPGDK